ncbi:unnamed protein product, partial [Cladocopium goreaui]
VEKNNACANFTMGHYPDSCHFRDILDLVQNPPENGAHWDSRQALKMIVVCWEICFHKDKKHWASKYSLEELAGILLVGKDTPVPLNYECYLFELRNANGALTEDQLTKSHAHHLEKFRRACPEKGLYDLSANVDKRKRVELKDRTLPCLTTSSYFWSEPKGRTMTGREHLHALGYPCWGPGAAAARVDPIDTSEVRESALRSMAGNGMSLPCAGFTLLMAVLFVEDK